ncbi:MAG: AIR carboxylase family protein [Chloroflexi bacterium]|nr:AIR carboxylase family protein [Chloroflexota bacterium]
MTDGPLVGVMMGSHSDWDTIKNTASTLESLGISWEARVLSAHRTPDETAEYAAEAQGRGIKVIIAAAGGAAALPGAVAAKTPIPVIGVPVKGWATDGLDSLLSMAQMLLAGRILALSHPEIADAVNRDRAQRAEEQLSQPHPTLD